MRKKFNTNYPENWTEIAKSVKDKNNWSCERCGHPHDSENGFTLTIHHLDGNGENNANWNLACLCQRCHLTIQGKVFLPQFYMFEHTDWFKPHLKGYLKSLEEFPK